MIFCGVRKERSTPAAAEAIIDGPLSGDNAPSSAVDIALKGGADSTGAPQPLPGVPREVFGSLVVSTAEAGSKRPQGFAVARGQSFLQGWGAMGPLPGRTEQIYPCLSNGEVSTVYFIMNHNRYFKLERNGWCRLSVDADQWMIILLAMGTGIITLDRDDAFDVTVTQHVKSCTEYIHVNRVYQAIVGLTESGEHAGWSPALPPCLDDGAKSILFVLVFVLNGCDSLPSIVNCAFPAIWKSMLGGLTIKKFFGEIVSHDRDGYTKINVDKTM